MRPATRSARRRCAFGSAPAASRTISTIRAIAGKYCQYVSSSPLRVSCPVNSAGIRSLSNRGGRVAKSWSQTDAGPENSTRRHAEVGRRPRPGDAVTQRQPDDVVADVEPDRAVPPPCRQHELAVRVARGRQLLGRQHDRSPLCVDRARHIAAPPSSQCDDCTVSLVGTLIAPPARLGSSDVHVWLGSIEAMGTPDQRAACLRLLTAEERARARRFRFERDHCREVLTRAMVRCCLSFYIDRHPAEWRFVQNEYGCPMIADPPVPLHFNVSHSGDRIACAVVPGGAVGIDVEERSRASTSTRSRRPSSMPASSPR